MIHETAINCLSERIRLREIQEKEYIQDGRHFDAKECRRQILDLQAAIKALETPCSTPSTPDTRPSSAAPALNAPGCPTNGQPETRPSARRGDPETVCKGMASICRGKSRKASKKGEIP